MDENTWRIVQIALWLVGIQTTLILSALGFLCSHLNGKFTKIDEEFKDMRKENQEIRVSIIRLEGAFYAKECCILKEKQNKEAK